MNKECPACGAINIGDTGSDRFICGSFKNQDGVLMQTVSCRRVADMTKPRCTECEKLRGEITVLKAELRELHAHLHPK